MKLIVFILFFIAILTLNVVAKTMTGKISRKVSISILVLDIITIDDANQRVILDFVVELEWMNKNLKNKWKEKKIVSMDDVWTPKIQILNDYNLEKKLKDLVEINPDGSVIYRQRFIGGISSRHNYSEFPLDDFLIKIQLISIVPDELILVVNKSFSEQQTSNYSISGWMVGSEWIEVGVGEERIKNLPNLTYFIAVKRKVNFYIWKIIIPLAVIVFMSWLVFWVDPIHISAQLTVGATAMLTIIAYQFTLSDLIPPVSYLTRLDIFILISNIIVFIALLEAVLTSNLVSRNKKKIARKIDYVSRIIFPVVYTIVFIKLFGYRILINIL